jgi:hypothetical protein
MATIPYCLNIHPGEDLEAVQQAIDTFASAVHARVAPDAPYPLGLRLSAAAAAALADDAQRDAFAARLAARRAFVTGINGFPYGAFHNTAVKTAVYQPDWSTPERLTYTGRLATILAALLPEGATGNISTVPLGYRGAATLRAEPSPEKAALYVRQIAVAAEFLCDLKQRTGREIVLALEPEPDCLLEDTNDVIAWFEDGLLTEGKRWLTFRQRRTPEEAEALLRTFVGLCLDTCHFAVAFEDPLTALCRFESAGVRVARIQLSAAIRATINEDALARLADFIDPVYLHQTKIRLPRGRIAAFPDLTRETLDAARAYAGCELRTHFHVPLFYEGDAVLGSTNADLTPDFFAHAAAHAYPLETETYTFDVLPPALRAASVVDSLVAEHAWVSARL